MHLSRYRLSLGRGARSLGCAAALVVAAGTTSALATPIVGLTGSNTLVGFDSATPGSINSMISVTGLGGDTLRGIDFRPSNGMLYGIGSSGRLYVIDQVTGAATSVGPGVTLAPGNADVGFAFNPVPDAIRVVAPNDQNLRVNPTTGATTADTPLSYAAGDQNAGANPSVAGSAYTNQVPGTVTSTALYGIDTGTGSLVLQSPPNAGLLTTVGTLGVAGLVPGGGVGFDIDGATSAAFASFFSAGGTSGLYSINLANGAATLIGSFTMGINDIAVGRVGAPVPEPASAALLGVGLIGLAAVRRRRRA